MIPTTELKKRYVTGTTHATPGTRTNHAHGLTNTPSINRIVITPRAPDNDTNNAAVVSLVAVTATNITVKGGAASIAFTAAIEEQAQEPFRSTQGVA